MRKLGFVLMTFFFCISAAYASETNTEQATESTMEQTSEQTTDQEIVDQLSDTLSYNEIDEMLFETSGSNEVTFTEYVKDLMLGGEKLSVTGIGRLILNGVLDSFQTDSSLFARLFFLVVIATLFKILADSFTSGQVAQTASMITFLLLAGLLLQCYLSAATVAKDTIVFVLRFMRLLIPVYLTSITFCTGVTTATAFYQVYIVLITICQTLVLTVLIPLCSTYLLLSVSGRLPAENTFDGFAKLTKSIITWGRRGFLAIATGFTLIQSLLSPGVDTLKRNVVTKSVSAIPGLGALFSGVTETVLSAGVVIKNAVGVAGIVVLLVFWIRPLVQLVVYLWLFRFAAAAASLIADKRMVDLINVTAEAIGLLLSIVAVTLVSFLVVLVIMTVTTTVH